MGVWVWLLGLHLALLTRPGSTEVAICDVSGDDANTLGKCDDYLYKGKAKYVEGGKDGGDLSPFSEAGIAKDICLRRNLPLDCQEMKSLDVTSIAWDDDDDCKSDCEAHMARHLIDSLLAEQVILDEKGNYMGRINASNYCDHFYKFLCNHDRYATRPLYPLDEMEHLACKAVLDPHPMRQSCGVIAGMAKKATTTSECLDFLREFCVVENCKERATLEQMECQSGASKWPKCYWTAGTDHLTLTSTECDKAINSSRSIRCAGQTLRCHTYDAALDALGNVTCCVEEGCSPDGGCGTGTRRDCRWDDCNARTCYAANGLVKRCLRRGCALEGGCVSPSNSYCNWTSCNQVSCYGKRAEQENAPALVACPWLPGCSQDKGSAGCANSETASKCTKDGCNGLLCFDGAGLRRSCPIGFGCAPNQGGCASGENEACFKDLCNGVRNVKSCYVDGIVTRNCPDGTAACCSNVDGVRGCIAPLECARLTHLPEAAEKTLVCNTNDCNKVTASEKPKCRDKRSMPALSAKLPCPHGCASTASGMRGGGAGILLSAVLLLTNLPRLSV